MNPNSANGTTQDDNAGQQLSDGDFKRLGGLAYDAAGLVLSQSKRSMVQSRLARRMQFLGRNEISDYVDFVCGPDPGDEVQAFVSAMTTNVSSFLREKHHFEALQSKVLPILLEGAKKGKRLRFWSAGCSSGQEPYTLAMLILRLHPNAAQSDIQILATDIDRNILRRARAGRYTARDLAILNTEDRAAFFSTEDESGQFTINEEVSRLVTFRHLNIHSDWPMHGTFDVILCRNVVIYFDTSKQRALWPKFHATLDRNGWLFLGHSERIIAPETFGFQADGVTTYRPLSAYKKNNARA